MVEGMGAQRVRTLGIRGWDQESQAVGMETSPAVHCSQPGVGPRIVFDPCFHEQCACATLSPRWGWMRTCLWIPHQSRPLGSLRREASLKVTQGHMEGSH